MKIKTQLAENYKILMFGKNPNFDIPSEKIDESIQEAYEAGWSQAFRVMQNSSIFEYHSLRAIEEDEIHAINVIDSIQEELTQLEDEEVCDI